MLVTDTQEEVPEALPPNHMKSQSQPTSTDTTRSGDINTTSQVMSTDSRTTTPMFMELMISLGDQTDTQTPLLPKTIATTGTTRVMVMFATLAEVTDADSAEDMDINTLAPNSENTDTLSRRLTELVTDTHTSVTSQDQPITSTDTVLVDATPRDTLMDTVEDTDSDMEVDTVSPTDGPCTTDTERVTHPPRDLLWVTVLVPMLLSQCKTSTDTKDTERESPMCNIRGWLK